MQKIIEVGQANFATEVLQRSHEIPVVVDFWAPWCGPCRMLGPTLERLANEPGSNFILAKVNSDHNPQLSMQYNVRGIPAVKAFKNGRVVDEFVGAQPEPVVRQFIQRVTAGFQPTSGAGQRGKRPSTPTTPDGRLQKARQLLRQGDGCRAQSLLDNFPAGPQAAEARKLLPLARFMCDAGRGQGLSGQADLDTVYRQAADALRRREYSGALYNLLVAYHQERPARQSQTKAVMEGIFTLLGENNQLTQQYRTLVNS